MKWFMGDCIYLHFMDRELRESLGLKYKVEDSDAINWVKTALFMTNMPIYVSLSHMYESYEEFPKTIKFLFELEKLDFVHMISNHTNPDEFIESRRALYSFDRERYEKYFVKGDLEWPASIYKAGQGTTEYLRKSILATENVDLPEHIYENIRKSLIENKSDAITIQRFIPLIRQGDADNAIIRTITNMRIMISQMYTKRYLENYAGTIITGLPGFGVYDELARNQIYSNYRIYHMLVENTINLRAENGTFIEYLFSEECIRFKDICRLICEYLFKLYESGEALEKILVMIRQYVVRNNHNIYGQLISIYNDIKGLCKKRGLNVMAKENTFLIIVATQLELKILLSELRENYPVEPNIGDNNYFSTLINGNIIYIVKCQMGTNGSGGAMLTTEDAISKLEPDIVIMCGIAWGGKRNSQQLGDVLVSTKVWEYDPAKMDGNKIIPRGCITPATPQLIQTFEMVEALEQNVKFHFGLIASGSLLLNDKGVVEQLQSLQPELIGGEMEIAGVASVCERRNKKWIMVKAICDWGYEKESDKKDYYQEIAAKNASHVLVEMLKKYNIGDYIFK